MILMKSRTIRAILNHPRSKISIKMGKFLLAGAPSFIVAIPLNILLVNKIGFAKPISYAIVLFLQVSANFLMCRRFVFTNRKEVSIFIQFGQFLSGILVFRLIDWALYSFIISNFSIHYAFVQIFNAFMLFTVKYTFSKRIMEK